MNKKEGTGWENLGSEEVLSTHIFKVYKDRTKCLRTDSEADFYRFETVNWVNVIAVTAEEKVVVIEQFRHGAQGFKLEIPGGCIDPEDPSPAEAGARELLEETGYAGDEPVVIGCVQPNPALQGNHCYTVLITNARKVCEARMEDMEDIETMLMSFDQLEEMTMNGEVDHGLVLNAFYFYNLYRRKNCKQ